MKKPLHLFPFRVLNILKVLNHLLQNLFSFKPKLISAVFTTRNILENPFLY